MAKLKISKRVAAGFLNSLEGVDVVNQYLINLIMAVGEELSLGILIKPVKLSKEALLEFVRRHKHRPRNVAEHLYISGIDKGSVVLKAIERALALSNNHIHRLELAAHSIDLVRSFREIDKYVPTHDGGRTVDSLLSAYRRMGHPLILADIIPPITDILINEKVAWTTEMFASVTPDVMNKALYGYTRWAKDRLTPEILSATLPNGDTVAHWLIEKGVRLAAYKLPAIKDLKNGRGITVGDMAETAFAKKPVDS